MRLSKEGLHIVAIHYSKNALLSKWNVSSRVRGVTRRVTISFVSLIYRGTVQSLLFYFGIWVTVMVKSNYTNGLSVSQSLRRYCIQFEYSPELNWVKGLSSPSMKNFFLLSFCKSKLELSLILRKLTASASFDGVGMIGGSWCRSRAQLMVLKNGCAFTSAAPAREPRRLFSSLLRSLRMMPLQLDDGAFWLGNFAGSGNATSNRKIRENVSFRFAPLNGVVPYCVENQHFYNFMHSYSTT